jgi:hypothetical protein
LSIWEGDGNKTDLERGRRENILHPPNTCTHHEISQKQVTACKPKTRNKLQKQKDRELGMR